MQKRQGRETQMNDEAKRRGRPPKVEAPIEKQARESISEAVEFLAHYATHKALGKRPRFVGKDFKGLRVVGHEVPAADFINCSFTGAHFQGCNLQGWLVDDKSEGLPILEGCDTRFGSFEKNKG